MRTTPPIVFSSAKSRICVLQTERFVHVSSVNCWRVDAGNGKERHEVMNISATIIRSLRQLLATTFDQEWRVLGHRYWHDNHNHNLYCPYYYCSWWASCNFCRTHWLVWCCSNRDELMRSPFCGHFTGCPSNIGWLTSWPFVRSTCDSRRHRRTWTVSSLTVSPLFQRVCSSRMELTVFSRIFKYVAVWKLLNQNWKHFYFVELLRFDRSQSASASSDFMALYKWFYLLTYLLSTCTAFRKE